MRNPARFPVLMAILILIPLVAEWSYAEGAGTRSDPWEPALSIFVDEDQKSVDVAPGSSGIVNFTIAVTCNVPFDAPSNLSVDLELYAWWWDVSGIPTMVFGPGASQKEVVISVEAPINTSSYVIVDLEIWGNWSYANNTINGTIERRNIARISVLPFYDLFIGSNFPKKYADVGDWAEFPFNITNRSNLDVNITLLIEEDSDHLIVQLDDRSFKMKKGETRSLVLRVRQDPSRSRGNTVHVYAYIDEDPKNNEWDLPLLFYTEPTLSTFFYEGNFLRLVLIILVIICVSAVLFFWEKAKKPRECEEEEGEPGRGAVNRRRLDFSGKK